MERGQKLVTAAAVNKETNLNRGTLYRMAKEGLVPCYRTGVKGRGLRFIIDEVLEALHHPKQIGNGEVND